MLRASNQRFANGKMLHRNLLKQMKETAAGQYPFAVVVSCLDSRTSSELIFDQGVGGIFNARSAGNIVNEDIIGSLEFATKVAGAPGAMPGRAVPAPAPLVRPATLCDNVVSNTGTKKLAQASVATLRHL